MGRVPLTRRNLLADQRRLIASITGVGLAVMLILLLDGLWAGVRAQTTLYTDRVGADLYVLQPGVRDLTAGASTLPMSALDTARADPQVAWASPVRSTDRCRCPAPPQWNCSEDFLFSASISTPKR